MYVKEDDPFAVTDEEYKLLQEQFGDLIYFVAWQLTRKNVKNNHTEELDDIVQQLNIGLIQAGRYTKRQVYIVTCLEMAKKYAHDKFLKKVVEELQELWNNRKKHGANKQKFGEIQEKLLDDIMVKNVPEKHRPNPRAPFRMDKDFHAYCKSIIWNQQKNMGRKISRERPIRNGLASLSEFDHLGAEI